MFRTQILESLRTKFNGVSDNVLGRIATKLAKTVKSEEDIQTAVDGVTVQQLIDNEGDFRAQGAADTAVATYEKKHNLKDGKAVKPAKKNENADEDEDEDGGEPMPKWARKFVEENKQLREEIRGLRTEKITDSRRQRLNRVLEKLPENQRKGYARISVDSQSDEDFDALIDEITAEVDELAKESATKGAVFNKPNAGKGGSKETDDKTQVSDEDADDVVGMMNI